MNSKEALEIIKHRGLNYKPEEWDEALAIIKQDLEVLELLKPIIKGCLVLKTNDINIGYLSANIKVNKMLKEWLENDK